MILTGLPEEKENSSLIKSVRLDPLLPLGGIYRYTTEFNGITPAYRIKAQAQSI